MLKKIIPLSALAGLLMTGIIHGRITNRWRYSDTLQSAVSKLPQLPLLVGNWDGTILKVDSEEAARRGVGSYVSARFVNRLQGDVVYVTLVCDRPGPLSLHPPTICLPAHGFSQNGAEIRLPIPLGEELGNNEFSTAEFLKTGGGAPEHIRFYWSYSAGGRWSVPTDPRISLARHPAVYKLYFFHRSSQADDPLGENPCLPFLRAYVPELQKLLFPS